MPVVGPAATERAPQRPGPSEYRAPEIVPPHAVRVVRPEREVIPNRPGAPAPTESRYIQKVPPTHPAEERSRAEPPATRSPDREAPRKSRPNDSTEKDQQR